MRRKNFSITQTCNFSFLKNTHASLDSRDTQLRYTESRVTSRLGGTPGRLGNRLPRIATRRVGATRRTCANLSLSLSLPPAPPLSLCPYRLKVNSRWPLWESPRGAYALACVRTCVCVCVGDGAEPRVTRVLTFSAIRSGPSLPSVRRHYLYVSFLKANSHADVNRRSAPRMAIFIYPLSLLDTISIFSSWFFR